MNAAQTVANVAHAALLEAGRPDLADEIATYANAITGPYLEFDEDILDEADWALINKAETLGRAAVGLPPINRVGT